MARFSLPLTTWSNGKKSLPFLHRELEIMDKSLQLWTELLNLSDTDSVPQVSFGQEQLSVYACGGKRFTGAAEGINTFWCSVHGSTVALAVSAHGCIWTHCTEGTGRMYAASQKLPNPLTMDPPNAGLWAARISLTKRRPKVCSVPAATGSVRQPSSVF